MDPKRSPLQNIFLPAVTVGASAIAAPTIVSTHGLSASLCFAAVALAGNFFLRAPPRLLDGNNDLIANHEGTHTTLQKIEGDTHLLQGWTNRIAARAGARNFRVALCETTTFQINCHSRNISAPGNVRNTYTDEETCFLLGHEIAHGLHQDARLSGIIGQLATPVCLMAAAAGTLKTGLDVLSGGGTGDLSAALLKDVPLWALWGATTTSLYLNNFLDELRADRRGLELSGSSLQAATKALKTIRQENGGGLSYHFKQVLSGSGHPPTAVRILALKLAARNFPQKEENADPFRKAAPENLLG